MKNIKAILLSSSILVSTLGQSFAAEMKDAAFLPQQESTQTAQTKSKIWVAGMDVLNAATSAESLDAFRLGQIRKDQETLQDAVLSFIESNSFAKEEATQRKRILAQVLNTPTAAFDNKTYLNYWFNRSLLFTPWGKSTLKKRS